MHLNFAPGDHIQFIDLNNLLSKGYVIRLNSRSKPNLIPVRTLRGNIVLLQPDQFLPVNIRPTALSIEYQRLLKLALHLNNGVLYNPYSARLVQYREYIKYGVRGPLLSKKQSYPLYELPYLYNDWRVDMAGNPYWIKDPSIGINAAREFLGINSSIYHLFTVHGQDKQIHQSLDYLYSPQECAAIIFHYIQWKIGLQNIQNANSLTELRN